MSESCAVVVYARREKESERRDRPRVEPRGFARLHGQMARDSPILVGLRTNYYIVIIPIIVILIS